MTRPGGPLVVPRGDAADAEEAYADFEATIELLRLLVADPKRWTAHFTGSFKTMLDPFERLALPGAWKDGASVG